MLVNLITLFFPGKNYHFTEDLDISRFDTFFLGIIKSISSPVEMLFMRIAYSGLFD